MLQTRFSLSSTSCIHFDQVLSTAFDYPKGSLVKACPTAAPIYFRSYNALCFNTTRDFSFEGWKGALSSFRGQTGEGISGGKKIIEYPVSALQGIIGLAELKSSTQ